MSVTYLWIVLESSESNHVAISVDRGYCQVCRFDQFEYFRIRVHAVVDVVLPDFDQVDNVITVIRICSPEYDALIVKFLLVFHNLLILCHPFQSVVCQVRLLQNLLFFRLIINFP